MGQINVNVANNGGGAEKLATPRLIDGVSFDGSANIYHYASCSTAAGTTEKAVALSGFTLVDGAKVAVLFTVTNTASNPTLNVNSTGAKPIYYRGSAISAGYLSANRTYEFVYNSASSRYDLVGDINTDTNTKVTNTLNTTAKAYVTGTTSATTNTGTQVFDTGVYLDTTAGTITATKFNGTATNADTLDGKHADDFSYSHGDTLDCNTAILPGTYNATPDTSNTPFSSYWNICVDVAANGSWIRQVATLSDPTSATKSYHRIKINDNDWNDWTNIADGGNADTLDGLHASNFTLSRIMNNKPHITSVTATESTIHLKWLPVDNATKYAVSKYNGTGTSYTTFSLEVTGTEYTITGLTSGTEYQILVQAYVGSAWNKFTVADNIIVRTIPVASTSVDGIMSAADKTKLSYTNIAYATCSTAAATAAKVATISGNSNWALTAGSIVVVKFTNTNTASNCTLNVNNSGAKSVWYNTGVYTGNSSTALGYASRYTVYMYDGTYWVWLSNGVDFNTTYSAATASAQGLVSTGAQTFAGAKTFNGNVIINSKPAETAVVARNIRAVASASVSSVTTDNLPVGSICFVY